MRTSVVRRRVAVWLFSATCVAAATAWMPARAAAQVTAYAFVPNAGSPSVIGSVSIIDTHSNTVVDTPSVVGSQLWSAAFTPDGRRAYIGDAMGALWELDVASHQWVDTHVGSSNFVPLGLAITHDGRKLYVADAGHGVVDVVDTTSNSTIRTLTVGTDPVAITLTPDGQRAWVANTNTASHSISVIDTSTDTLVGSAIDLGIGFSPTGVAFTLDGTRAYVSGFIAFTAEVLVIDVASDAILTTIPMPGPTGLVVTKDGSKVLVADYNSGAVQVIDTATNTLGPAITLATRPASIALTPDGTSAYVTNPGSNTVSVIDVARLAVVQTIAVGLQPEGTGGGFIGPNIITTNCAGCGSLDIFDDSDLTARGFGQFVNFNNGILTAFKWTTSRTISLLAGGGTIRTTSASALNGDIINDGALTIEGPAPLTIAGRATHAGGTTVTDGFLGVLGTHVSPLHLRGGTLFGTGTIGALDATAGHVFLGTGNGPGILHADTATLAPGVSLIARLNGPVAGTQYDQFATGRIDLGGASLGLLFGYAPTPGDTFTIVTNATGTFSGKPEGSAFDAGGGHHVRISYHGGSGSDVVVTADDPPTLSAFSNQQIGAGSTLGPLAFTVGDDLTAATALTVTASSTNSALLPNADIVIGGSGASRTLTATPVPGTSGVTLVTVSVSDGSQTTQKSFVLTVVATPVYYLAEGATGNFFSTDLLLANPNATPAPVVITFYKDDGTTVVRNQTLPATSRTTLRVNQIDGMEAAAFSTSVTSTNALPLVVERTMWWDASGYGSSGEKASAAAASTWYFAEGSQGYFHTYILLLNPHAVSTVAHATYFLDDGSTVRRDYTVAATSRLTIDAASEPALLNRSFGAVFAFDLPGMAERAMYFGGSDTSPFAGGHAAAGVTMPNTTWYLAEGATGSYFDTFVLVANPNAADATVTLTYLPDNGTPLTKAHALAAHQRLTVNIADEDPALASAAVSTRVDSDQPVVAERSQYWPHAAWYEAHNSTGETTPGTKWGLAEGRVGGSNHAQTYILIANPGTQSANITATFLRGDGTTLVKTFNVGPTSRFNIAVTGLDGSVPELVDESFGTVIDSTQPVIVERSMYTDANGLTWAAGTNATGTRLP